MDFYRTVFKIALPIIMQNFLTSFVNMIDTVMVGQLGAVEIAAVGLGNQIFFVMNTVMFGVVSGGSIFMSQFWGKKDISRLRQTMGITVALAFAVSMLFTVLAAFFPEKCLSVYTSDVSVILHGASYLRVVSPCYFFFGISMAFGHALRSTEHVNLPMAATGISVLVNAIGNAAFIFGVSIGGTQIIPTMGIQGAAAATVFSRIVETVILTAVPVIKKYEIIGKLRGYLLTDFSFLGKYARICLPVLINESLWGFGISMQNSIFAHAGTDVIAAFNIRGTIDNLVWVFFIGTGNAAAILIGKKIGERNYDGARLLANKMARFMPCCAAVLAPLMIPLSFLLPYFFNVQPHITRMAAQMLYLVIFFYPFCAFNMCMIVGVCRSGGDTVFASFIDAGFMWLIALPLGFIAVLVFHWPYWALFLCVHTEDILKATAGFIRLKSGKWLHDLTE